jgi:hypothetical protein
MWFVGTHCEIERTIRQIPTGEVSVERARRSATHEPKHFFGAPCRLVLSTARPGEKTTRWVKKC